MLGSISPLIIFFANMWRLPEKKRPDFRKVVNYFSWIMYPVGGLIVWSLYKNIVSYEVVAFHLGATAPLILGAFGKIWTK